MVDFTKKIINSNKFRGPAIRFQETGRYCDYPLGTSEFLKHWDEEKRRCLEGYTADDGDYITGYNYFYLNYCPINRQVYEKTIDRKGNEVIKKKQIFEFPDFWDYDYYYFSSVEEAEEQGKHLCVLKSRRRGYSYKAASMMCRNYYLIPASKSYVYASNKQYLTEDGVLTKAWDQMDFIDKNTAWGKKRSVNTAMRKRAGFISKDEFGNEVELGYKSEIIGVTLKDNPDAGHPYDETIYTPNGITKWENINIGSTLFDSHGGTCKVTNVFELGNVDVYNVYLNDGRIVQATDDHKWRIYRYGYKKKEGKERKALKEYEVDTKQLLEMLNQRSYSKNPARIKTSPCVEFNSQYVPIDAYTLGLLLGDGCIKKASKHGVPFTQLPADKEEIEKYVPYEIVKTGAKAEIAYSIEILNAKQIFFDLGLTEKVSVNKFVPDCYKYNSVEVRLGVINGLLDTDGSVTKDCGVIEYVSKSKRLAMDMQWLLFSIGIRSSIHIKLINNTPYYRIYIYCRGDETRLFNLSRKKERIAIKKLTPFALSKVEYSQIEKVVYIGKKKSKCVTVDSEDHVYLIKDFVETRNCRGKKANLILFEEAGSFSELSAAWQIARPSVEIDGVAFAPMICYGTGGDKDSNFGALKDMFYNPKGFNCLEFDNIWDDNPGDAKCGFFIPQYTNIDIRDESGKRLYMDEDGNTRTKESIEYILSERKKILEASTNAEAIDRYVAERPITPREAMLEFNGNIFPKKEILEQLSTIRTHKNLQNHKQVGDLVWDGDGNLHWQIKKVGDITHYPLKKDDNPEGSIVIWEHPNKNATTGLYIAGIDSYDYDSSSTTSLGSCFIYKRIQTLEEYSDIIVAEYTGRPATSEEFYENVRKLLIYYNARAMYENQNKGIFVYFSNKHCDYLLADQPDIINDIVGNSKVQRKKGCHMNKQIKQWGEGLIKEWLNDLDSTGKKNVFNVLSEPLLEELLAYSDTANTDRVMALMQVMIYREQLYNIVVKEKTKENKARVLFEGPIFSQNWFRDDEPTIRFDNDNVYTF